MSQCHNCGSLAVHLIEGTVAHRFFAFFCLLSQVAVIETLEKASLPLKWSTEYQNVAITQRDWEMSKYEMHLNAMRDEHKLIFCKYLSTIDD